MPNLVKKKRCRVELHVHLDGSIRVGTVIDLARQKGIKLPVDSEEELKRLLQKGFGSLQKFLEAFSIFMPTVVGDREAIKRIAYEFCEDIAKDGLIYAEVRYCPHLFLGNSDQTIEQSEQCLQPRDVVKMVNEGLRKGNQDFKVTTRTILCCIKSQPEWSHEILELCKEFADEGVVGIDIAGDENQPMDAEHIKTFKAAKQAGIHRTVHAGECGSYKNVKEAVYEFDAERIGHGYHVLESEELYQDLRTLNVHFETCPLSSYATGAVTIEPEKHPITRFAKDNVNFSINTDDPILTGHPLTGDYELVTEKMGLSQEQLLRAEFNAAESCFLPHEEKKVLLNRMKKEFQQWLHHLDPKHHKFH